MLFKMGFIQGETDRLLGRHVMLKIFYMEMLKSQDRGCCNTKTRVSPKFKLFGGKWIGNMKVIEEEIS